MKFVVPLIALCFPFFSFAENFRNIQPGANLEISASQTLHSMDKPVYGQGDGYIRRKIKEFATYASSETSPQWFQTITVPEGTIGTVEKVQQFWIPSPNTSPDQVVVNIVVSIKGERFLITQRAIAPLNPFGKSGDNQKVYADALAKISEFSHIRVARP